MATTTKAKAKHGGGKHGGKKKAGNGAAPKAFDTLIGVALDRTGSMQGCAVATRSGFNEFLKQQRQTQNGAKTLVTLAQFDSPAGSPEIDFNFVGIDIGKVPDLDASNYIPRGMTPLHDAIVAVVGRMEKWVTDEKWAGKVLCVIITDGQENASREATLSDVSALVTRKEKEGWNFLYIGANQDAFATGARMGLHPGSVANYSSSPIGTRRAFASVGANTTAYRMSGASGQSVAHTMFAQGRPKLDGDDDDQTAPPKARTSRRVQVQEAGRVQVKGA